MPHTVLEFSRSINDSSKAAGFSQFFKELHLAFAATGILEMGRLKGRIIEHPHAVVGDSESAGFIYLQISLLEGRTNEQQQVLLAIATQILGHWLKTWQVPASCSVTIEMREMREATHRKITVSS